ncbi:UrcA family protein [Caulobacter sp. Root1455]|jgi:UrcA family protein|uniref:UrcA family protein n=1 Tax=unclassified Caulobacter TaxID=2648921 RepID=UPI0006F57863|nr:MULTISPECIES: UrcA family protein [unclassified Caulobacter]KQY34701.1 UrcA family protein [Caulobacter sp. Root487D2Y]KQZ03585.1 UrcA family protein [Caulobacter sp. Root1455]
MSRFIVKRSTVAAPGLAVLVALSALGLTQAAQAAPAQPVVLATIPVGDLDLSRPDDARVLKARIEAAREAVCDARARTEGLDRWSAKACRIDIRDEVESKLSQRQARALRGVGG